MKSKSWVPFGAWLIVLGILLWALKSKACGYGFVSDCATTLSIVNNGTESGFQVSQCPYQTVFHNHNFGNTSNLVINSAQIQTSESCNNDVLDGRLHYRIYDQNASPGSFTTLEVPQFSSNTNGPYTGRIFKLNNALDVLSGLGPGNYYIELYFSITVSFNGNGIADDTLFLNNNGQYYRASFSVQGSGGQLALTLANKANPTCHGASNGSASININNGTAPFTVNWSNGATGTSATGLAAGSYTVSATDANGLSGSMQVILIEPQALNANVTAQDESSAAANNGSASANPFGGTWPYSHLWSTGATTSTINQLDAGVYMVTVSDANGCTATATAIVGTGNNQATYCAAKGDFPWVDWITGVEINDLNNSSGKSQYSDFTGMPTTLNAGSNYTFFLSNGFSWQTYDEYWTVWIDYNQNGTFEEPAELAYSGILTAPPLGTPSATIEGTVAVPATAQEGPTRMRVALKRGAFATPCETIPFGEVEDYTIIIGNGAPPPCNINAVATTPFCDDNNTPTDPADDLFTFNLTVNGSGTAATWDASVAGQSFFGNYGAPTELGPFDISGGAITVSITDANDSGCTTTVSVEAPQACSTPVVCDITTTVNNLLCHDAGTPNNPDDDTYTFLLTVSGSNPGDGWTTTVLGTPWSGTIGTPITMGPYAINSGILNFSVQHTGLPACSTAVSVSPPPACSNGGGGTTYCASVSDFPWHDWIGGVAVSDLANPSFKSPYSDFTGLTANVTAGDSYPIDLTAGFSWFTYDEHWSVWIDFNQNGVFEEPDELVFSQLVTAPPNGTLEATVNGTLQIPLTASTGPTRMRVTMKRGSAAQACETLPYGEVEDYNVNIAPAVGQGTSQRALALQLDAVPQTDHINLYGVIELVPEARSFTLFRLVEGAGAMIVASQNVDPLTHNYQSLELVDSAPVNGRNDYQLILFDVSGKPLGHALAAAIFTPLEAFSAFPNPATQSFQLEAAKFKGQNLFLRVNDLFGREVFLQQMDNYNGHLIEINCDQWPSGLYTVYLLPEGRRGIPVKVVVEGGF